MIDLSAYSDRMKEIVVSITHDQADMMFPIVDRAISEVRVGTAGLEEALEEINDAATIAMNITDTMDVLAHKLAVTLWQGILMQKLDEMAEREINQVEQITAGIYGFVSRGQLRVIFRKAGIT